MRQAGPKPGHAVEPRSRKAGDEETMTMTSDVRGCSTCAPGEERYEQYHLSGMTGNRYDGNGPKSKRTRVQYDYRTPDGDLFSCIGLDLADCRRKRDHWLKHGRRYVSCSGMPRQTINA